MVHYSNVVPQWQRINNGNWKTVEEGVRSAARKRGVTLLVYTGTLGIFKVSQEENYTLEENRAMIVDDVCIIVKRQ